MSDIGPDDSSCADGVEDMVIRKSDEENWEVINSPFETRS